MKCVYVLRLNINGGSFPYVCFATSEAAFKEADRRNGEMNWIKRVLLSLEWSVCKIPIVYDQYIQTNPRSFSKLVEELERVK